MADSNTIKNLQDVVREVEEMEFKRNCEAHVRQELLEVLYRASELLECLVADSDSAELPPLELKPRKHKKKGSV